MICFSSPAGGVKRKMPRVFNGWVSRFEKAVSSNRTSGRRFLARLPMSCSTFQPGDSAARSDWGDGCARHIGARPGKNNQMRSRAGSLNGQLSLFFPKVIKVEPVVGRQAAVMFQAVGVALGPLLDLLLSMLPVDRDLIGKQLEMNLVAVASAVEPEEENDRYL